jgi:glycosyltransferase involved in cell wall biosynthesis
MLILAIVCLIFATIPALMVVRNLQEFQPATNDRESLNAAREMPISVLIPARNEATGIGTALNSILKTTHGAVELLVLDDHSEDDTAAIVKEFAQGDPRVLLYKSVDLPEGWNGKQHACWQLANKATSDMLLFLDADVILSPDALTRLIAEQRSKDCALLSGFPNQILGTWSEQMLIPMMHFLLLGYLPLHQMRKKPDPAFAAGCGQLILSERNAYFASGGHQAIAGSRHDGIQLPRSFRRHGFRTDLFDASDIASCRMYRSRQEVMRGLLKNATEGIANVKLIFVFTLLLMAGVVLPPVLLIVAIFNKASLPAIIILAIATVAVIVPRWLLCRRLKQSALLAFLHPISVAWFLMLQWYAWLRSFFAKPIAWRGRN